MKTKFIVVIAILIAVFTSSNSALADGCAEPQFAAARVLHSGVAFPHFVAVGDFNGDGIPDLVVADEVTNFVSVLLGKGDGTFQTNVNYTTLPAVGSVQVSDINHDGTNDLIIQYFGGPGFNSVSVLLGNGDGTFQTNVIIGGITPSLITPTVAADLNNDGINDFVYSRELPVCSTNNSIIKVALGEGNLTFLQDICTGFVPNTSVTPWSIAVADLNADGVKDLIVGTVGSGTNLGEVVVLLGNGDGSFQPQLSVSTGFANQSLVVGDFNGDGTNDVIAAVSDTFTISNDTNFNVTVLLSNGDGTLRKTAVYPTGTNAVHMLANDLNRDGRLDLVVLNSTDLLVFLGQGDGTFQLTASYRMPGNFVAVGDFDSDGIPDLVVTSVGLPGDLNLWLLKGNGDGTFQGALFYTTGVPDGVGDIPTVTTGDFNGDGKPDIAVANYSTNNNISVLLNKGDGTYGTNVNYFTGNVPQSIAVGDFNNDNKADLVVANVNSPYISLLLGNGDGTFQTNIQVGSLLIGAYWVVGGDFNHDNKLDIAAPGHFTGGIDVYLGNGNGTFQAPINSGSLTFSFGGRALGGDVNNDGKLDIVQTSAASSNVLVWLGNGNGTFQPAITNSVGTGIKDIALGDLNGDGKLDIAVANYLNGAISVSLGNGNGTFQPSIDYLVDADFFIAVFSVRIGDVNGDGKPDLIVSDGNLVRVLLNNGDGTFQPAVPFGMAGGQGTGITVDDVNRDGHLDVIVATVLDHGVSVLLNTCPSNAPPGLACTLSPALATNTAGTAHTVVATVTSNGVAKAGALVSFSVVGVNVGHTGTVTTSVGGLGTFTYTGTIVGTDTIRAIATASGHSATGTATKVWIAAAPNQPPTAVCQDVTTNANGNCVANVPATAVDNGSSDPDGDPLTFSLSPPGPYAKGVTGVTLTVADNRGGTDTCSSATITVLDQTAPVIACPVNLVTNLAVGVSNAVVNFSTPAATDNCGTVNVVCTPPSGTDFAFGTNPVVCVATDGAGNTNGCTFNVILREKPPVPHDLAVVTLKAPKKIALSATITNKVGKFSVSIQNLGPLTEIIPNLTALSNLVSVAVESLGTNCPSFLATLVPPKAAFPINLASKKKLTLSFTATFNCANDPLGTSKTAAHNDYRTTATVDFGALGEVDTTTSNDICPRPPNPAIGDPGCGNKDPITKELGADVLIDVVVK